MPLKVYRVLTLRNYISYFLKCSKKKKKNKTQGIQLRKQASSQILTYTATFHQSKENEKIKDKRVKLRSHKLRGPKHYLLSTYFQEYTSYKVNIKSSSD